MKNKVFVKTGKVDEKGVPYVKLIEWKYRKLFPENQILDWVKLRVDSK